MQNTMSTTQNITEKLRAYKESRAQIYGIETLGLFGSVARGEHTEGSDVDVCVRLKHPKLFTLVHIKEELQELLKCSVDIVRLRDDMDELLLRNINRDGVYV